MSELSTSPALKSILKTITDITAPFSHTFTLPTSERSDTLTFAISKSASA